MAAAAGEGPQHVANVDGCPNEEGKAGLEGPGTGMKAAQRRREIHEGFGRHTERMMRGELLAAIAAILSVARNGT